MPAVADHEDDLAATRRRLADALIDRDQLAELRAELERSEAEVARLPQLEHDLQHERRRAEIAAAERDRLAGELQGVADLQERLDRAQRALADLQASPSWRITRPLRLAKRLLR